MPKTPLLSAIESRNLNALEKIIARGGARISAREMGAAGAGAWTAGLRALVKAGGDLNGIYRSYRPLHGLIQANPRESSASKRERLACLEWMLAHGADTELAGAWPPARALVVAAFQGEERLVRALKDGGARIDIFTAAALGDARRVGGMAREKCRPRGGEGQRRADGASVLLRIAARPQQRPHSAWTVRLRAAARGSRGGRQRANEKLGG